MARFFKVLASHAPRLNLTNSAIPDPTGATISPQVAHQVLLEAAAHGVIPRDLSKTKGFLCD